MECGFAPADVRVAQHGQRCERMQTLQRRNPRAPAPDDDAIAESQNRKDVKGDVAGHRICVVRAGGVAEYLFQRRHGNKKG